MTDTLTLDRRLALARETRSKGYNCAQSVLAAFPDIFMLPQETCLRLGTALGGGLGTTGSTCGVLEAMALAEGMRTSGQPADKVAAYASYRSLHDAFMARHGDTLCPGLKARKIPCNELIYSGIEMYHNYIESED